MKGKRYKILYKDSGLDLDGKFGKCDIYIDNNINPENPLFVVETQDHKYRYKFTLLYITDASENMYDTGICPTRIRKWVYKYITTEKDPNGIIKWYNMLASINIIPEFSREYNIPYKYMERFNVPDYLEFDYLHQVIIFSHYSVINRIKSNIFIGNDYKEFPVIHIIIGEGFKKESLIRLDTLKHYAGYKLSPREYKDLINILASKGYYKDWTLAEFMIEEWNASYKKTFMHEYLYDIELLHTLKREP